MRTLVFVAIGTLVLAVIGLAGEDLRVHLDAIDQWLANLGPMAKFGYVFVLIIGTTLLLPESLFAILGGMLFGLSWGLPLALVGNLLAACLQYTLARRLLPLDVLRQFGSHALFERVSKVLRAADFRLQAFARLTPLNPAALNYVLGAQGVPFLPFITAAPLSVTHIFAEVYFGYAGSHALHRVSGSRPEGGYLHDTIVAAGLLATAIGLIVISHLAMKAIERGEATTHSNESS